MSSESESTTEVSEEVSEYKFNQKCRAVFHLHERGSGSILTKDLGSALRALGQIPSDQEVELIASKLEQEDVYEKGYTKISFDDFYKVVLDNSERRDDIKEMVLDSFKTLDPTGTGVVEAAKLTALLTGMGETLNPAEMKELLQEAEANKDGKVDYIKFVEHLLLFEATMIEKRPTAKTNNQENQKKHKRKKK